MKICLNDGKMRGNNAINCIIRGARHMQKRHKPQEADPLRADASEGRIL
jgi:hypothetical protein